MKKKIGALLMLVSLSFIVYLYFPLVFPPKVKNIGAEYSIYIPKIEARSPIVLNVNPWEENDYREKLKTGVAHAQSTAIPGEQGTSYLFAHSSDYPWNSTRYNTVFFKLNNLETGDQIFINETEYKVTDKKVVWPNDVEFLTSQANDNSKQLILQTCTPIGTSLKRLLVFAKAL